MQERCRVLAVSSGSVWSLGWLSTWLAECGIGVDLVRPFDGEPLPRRVGHDALLVLPGSVGVYEDTRFPCLAHARRLIGHAAEDGLPVLGVCFGAQLMATAFGGRVDHIDGPGEFGVRRIRRTPATDRLLDTTPRETEVVLWHDDAVTDVPDGAVVLAENDVCLQAYRLGEQAWGIQFHPEATLAGVRRWSRLYAETLSGHGLGESDMTAQFLARHRELHDTWRPFVHRFAATVTGEHAGPALASAGALG